MGTVQFTLFITETPLSMVDFKNFFSIIVNDLEKEMATYSSILTWEIPWKEVPGRLQSMGLQRAYMTKN